YSRFVFVFSMMMCWFVTPIYYVLQRIDIYNYLYFSETSLRHKLSAQLCYILFYFFFIISFRWTFNPDFLMIDIFYSADYCWHRSMNFYGIHSVECLCKKLSSLFSLFFAGMSTANYN